MSTMTGTRLREWRRRANLTQAQAAEKAGLSQSQFSRFEAGESLPELASALAIARLTRGEVPPEAWDLGSRPTAAKRKGSVDASAKRRTRRVSPAITPKGEARAPYISGRS